MTLDIAAIKARDAEATEGPWDWRGRNGQLWSKNADGLLIHPILMPIHEYGCGVDIDARDENMDFIAHARQDIPALIAAFEESEAARVKAEQERDALKADRDSIIRGAMLLEQKLKAELSDSKAKVAKYEMAAFKEALHQAEAAKLRKLIPVIPDALEARK